MEIWFPGQAALRRGSAWLSLTTKKTVAGASSRLWAVQSISEEPPGLQTALSELSEHIRADRAAVESVE